MIAGGILSLLVVSFFLIRKFNKKDDILLPNLTLSIESNENTQCAVKLINKGKGTAVIKNVNFWSMNKGETLKDSIDQVFPFNKSLWVNNSTFSNKDYFLASGDFLYLGKLSKEKVQYNGENFVKTKQIFEEQIKALKIKVEYSDVFSHKQPPLIYNN